MNKKTKINIYDIYQLKALNSVLNKNFDYFERKVRRWYSKNFYTALDRVYTLSWDFVLKNYYEAMIEQLPYNEIYDLACKEFLPEITEIEDKKEAEYMKELEAEQEAGLKKQSKPKEIKINFEPEDPEK
jgi:hypothetical protein